MTADGPRRTHPLRAGPGRKSSAWRAASFLVAWGLIFMLWRYVTPEVVHLGGTGRIGIALTVLGLLTSLPYALEWLRGRVAEHGPQPREAVQVREVEGSGGSTYVVITSPQATVPAPVATAERSVRVKEVGPGWYLGYMLFWRGPVTLGDALLTALWNGIARFQGRSEERYALRASAMDGLIEWPDADERPTGE